LASSSERRADSGDQPGQTSALAGGYELGFVIAASCVAVGLLIVLTILRSPRIGAGAVAEEENWEAEAAAS
jgi:hypothetical protein